LIPGGKTIVLNLIILPILLLLDDRYRCFMSTPFQ